MRRLGEKDFIRKVRNGLYIVNPEFLMIGRDSKLLRLWHDYCQAERIGRKGKLTAQDIPAMAPESSELDDE